MSFFTKRRPSVAENFRTRTLVLAKSNANKPFCKPYDLVELTASAETTKQIINTIISPKLNSEVLVDYCGPVLAGFEVRPYSRKTNRNFGNSRYIVGAPVNESQYIQDSISDACDQGIDAVCLDFIITHTGIADSTVDEILVTDTLFVQDRRSGVPNREFKEQAINEIDRILKPGGILIFGDQKRLLPNELPLVIEMLNVLGYQTAKVDSYDLGGVFDTNYYEEYYVALKDLNNEDFLDRLGERRKRIGKLLANLVLYEDKSFRIR